MSGDDKPSTGDVFTAGLEVRRQMFGVAGADDQIRAATDFTGPLQEQMMLPRWLA